MKRKKLCRGVSDKQLREYNKRGIPPKNKFFATQKDARLWGKNIVLVNHNKKCFKKLGREYLVYRKTLGLSVDVYENICRIKNFKTKKFT